MPKRSRRDSLTSEESCFSNNDQSSSMHSSIGAGSVAAAAAAGDQSLTPSASAAGLVMRKRRRQGVSIGIRTVSDQCQQALDSLRLAKNADGAAVCEPFIRLPSRRSQPELFEAVTTPIDLTRIQAKIKSDEYPSFEAFTADLDLLISNARSVYKPGAAELQLANQLADFVARLQPADAAAAAGSSTTPAGSSMAMQRPPRRAASGRRMAADGCGSSVAGSDYAEEGTSECDRHSLAPSEDANTNASAGMVGDSAGDNSPQIMQELLLAAVARLSNESGRSVSEHFEVLPSPRDYPQYYEVIRDPIDLRMIAGRILRGGHYKALDDLERDLVLMVRNARTFNEPKSEVYVDALAINKQLKACRTEALTRSRSSAALSDARKTVERLAHLPDPELAELLDEEAGVEGGEGDSEEEESYSPDDPRAAQMRLFSFVISYRNSQGQNLAEPFLRLPLKRLYPDYYEDIKNPLSLLQVRTRIRRRAYPDLDAMFDALNLVFNNARQYNIDESKIHKDAARLQKLVKAKRDELCGLTVSATGVDNNSSGGPGSDDLKPLLPQKLVNPLFQQQSLFHNEDSLGSASSSMLYQQQQQQQFSMTHTPSQQQQQQQPSGSTEKRSHHKRSAADPQDAIQRRLNNLYGHVYNATEEGSGRLLREIFVKLPAKSELPLYYQVIPEPIDLTMIRAKIDSRKYESHHQLVSDLKLMFANAKHFNEEKSQVHQDAIYLERLLKKKTKNLGPAAAGATPGVNGSGGTPRMKKSGTEISIASSGAGLAAGGSAGVTPASSLPRRLQDLLQAVRDYRDPASGRILSAVFARLPTRQELPQYYEYIKKPIDLGAIQVKLSSGKYAQAADMLADLELMFDNACLFNETGSQIYQDALLLLRVVMEKRRLLRLDDDSSAGEVPDVMAAVRDIMKGLLTQTMNYADEDGRVLVDSFDELYDEQQHQQVAEGVKRVIPLEEIFHRVQSGQYRRFDRFQADLFDALSRIRAAASSRESQIYKDACELQRYFVRTRDGVLCTSRHSLSASASSSQLLQLTGGPGAAGSLQSPASGFTSKMLDDLLKAEASAAPASGDATPAADGEAADSDNFKADPEIKEVELTAGGGLRILLNDFVYVRDEDSASESIEDPSQSAQVRVGQVLGFAPNDAVADSASTEQANGEAKANDGESVAAAESGLKSALVRINWFLKPKETAHSRHRKFLTNEVFKTDQHATVSSDRILAKCHVMNVKDYQNFAPRGFDSKDVYVCEFQYFAGERTYFQKITRWTVPRPESVINDKRPNPLSLHRMAIVPYVFDASTAVKTTGSAADDDGTSSAAQAGYIESPRANVVLEDRSQTEGLITYDQYAADPTSGLWLRLGDFVYVPSVDGTGRTIVRVDKLWRNTVQNSVYFSGPWFLPPKDVEHLPTRTLYANEYFLCSVEHSTHMLSSVMGRCCVLSPADYAACRPTEYAEADVYVCDNKYFLDDKAIRKLKKGLKKFANQPGTIEDELYYFKRPIVPKKSVTPLLYQASQTPLDMDQLTASSATGASAMGGSGGGGSSNFDDDNTRDSLSTSTTMDEAPVAPGTPQGGRGRPATSKKSGKKCPSGYVVYASEVRKRIMLENEGAGFGDISREVGQMWRKLPQAEKDIYERKAADARAKMEAEQAASSHQSPPPPPQSLYQQQQQQPPLQPFGQHFPQYPMQPYQYQQQQQQFIGQAPMYPQMGYPQQQQQPGVTFYQVAAPQQQQHPMQLQRPPVNGMGPHQHQQQPMLSMQQQQQQHVPPPPPPQVPIFVAVPPKTTRALHSEIYKRYIERLRSNSPYLSDWDKQATPARNNCRAAGVTQQLHDSFIGAPSYLRREQQQQQQQQSQAELTSALCNLRDHLLRDALKIELSLNQL